MVVRYPVSKITVLGDAKEQRSRLQNVFNYAVIRAARTKIEVLVDLVRDLPYHNVLPYKIIYLVRDKGLRRVTRLPSYVKHNYYKLGLLPINV